MTVLTVMVGAGASYDCVGDASVAEFQNRWRPPLVNQLFELRSTFSPILKRYPKAELLAGTIRERLRQVQGEHWKPLERLLLEGSSQGHAVNRKKYREIPLYLQELIGEVSSHFIRFGASMFAPLVAEVADAIHAGSYSRVLFLTVNYDLFLDREIERTFDHRLNLLGNYVDHDQWKLVKLHGSVNWGYELFQDVARAQPGDSIDQWHLDEISKMSDDPLSSGKPLIKLPHHQARWINNRFYYPALAMPVEVTCH